MRPAKQDTIYLCGRKVSYRLIDSKSARKLRVRVGVRGVEVVHPAKRKQEEVEAFICANGQWIVNQLERVERFQSVRRPRLNRSCEILYRGNPTPILIEDIARRAGTNKVVFEQDSIIIIRGRASRTTPAKSLENWLRKRAREEVMRLLDAITKRLGRFPCGVYIMGQRTKWGNCSALQNLSFNWRLILAPEQVLRYIVAHEAVHLAVPDHSKKFWLTVQSICPKMEMARQWLSAHGDKLLIDLAHFNPN
jgi:predicted metal-dependent hydrolase